MDLATFDMYAVSIAAPSWAFALWINCSTVSIYDTIQQNTTLTWTTSLGQNAELEIRCTKTMQYARHQLRSRTCNQQQASSCSSPVSIQTQSLALRELRKRKPQETQALAFASSQSWLPLLRPSIPIGWRLRLLRENFRRNRRTCNQQQVTGQQLLGWT